VSNCSITLKRWCLHTDWLLYALSWASSLLLLAVPSTQSAGLEQTKMFRFGSSAAHGKVLPPKLIGSTTGTAQPPRRMDGVNTSRCFVCTYICDLKYHHWYHFASADWKIFLGGADSAHTNSWFSDASYWLVNGGSGHLLAFNEPEQSSQSNLSPQDAANAYRTYMTPFSGRAQLGSPAVSNDGWSWLTEFMSLCGNCGVTFIAVHWYNDWTLFGDFQNWVNAACSFGLPVWITEVIKLKYYRDLCSRNLVWGVWLSRSTELFSVGSYSMAWQQCLRLSLCLLWNCR